jgi:hypothetical protein
MGLALGSGLRQKAEGFGKLSLHAIPSSSGRRIWMQALATAANNRSAEIASIELIPRPTEPQELIERTGQRNVQGLAVTSYKSS